jgi:tetratricopeptide (TPR) repeat protein
MTAMTKKKKAGTAKSQPDRIKKKQFGIFQHRETSAYLIFGIFLLSCFVLLLPVVVSYDFYNPYTFLKSILFRAAVQVMVFLYVILALISPVHRPRFQRITYALLGWFGIMLLCSLPGISVNAWRSWWGGFARMDGMFAQLHLLAYFFVLVQTFSRERDWWRLFTCSLFSSVLMGITGLIQANGLSVVFRFEPDTARIYGATGNADFIASFFLFNVCIALYFLLLKRKAEAYPAAAKIWLILVVLFDVWLVVWDAGSGGQVLSLGFRFLPLILFFLVLHGLTLFWFLMRSRVWAGVAVVSALALWDLFWMNQSQTRAAVVGLAAAVLFLLFAFIWKGTGRRLKWAAILAILLFGALSFAIFKNQSSGWVAKSPLLARLSSTSFAERRFVAWRADAAGMLDRPLLGWGLEHYREAFDLHAPARLFRGSKAENWDDRAHNVVLDVGITTGFLGLAAFVFFYGLVFVSLLRLWLRNRAALEHLSIAALLVAYLAQDMFIFDTVNTNGILFLVLAYATYLCRRLESNPQDNSLESTSTQKKLSPQGYLIVAVTAGILFCACNYLVREPFESNRLMQNGIASSTVAGPPPDTARYIFRNSILDDFRRAEEYRTTGRFEVREALANYASELVLTQEVPLQERVRVSRAALEALDRSILEDPNDSRPYMYAASLSNRTIDVIAESDRVAADAVADQALQYLQKAERLGPNRPRLFVERAQLFMHLGRTNDSIASLKKARDLDPANRRIGVDLAAILVMAGRYKEAENEWQRVRSLHGHMRPEDYERMIGLYANKKRMGAVVALRREQLEESPNDPVILSRLAVAYRDSGDLAAARQTALKAANLSPQVNDQLDAFLKTLEPPSKK